MPPSDDALLETLRSSDIFRDYAQAFAGATDLALRFRSVTLVPGAPGTPLGTDAPLCLLLARPSERCSSCLAARRSLASGAQSGTAVCFAGLCTSAVPVRAGERIVGFLETGQVALAPPTPAKFRKVASHLVRWGIGVDLKQAEDAYLHTRVLPVEKYQHAVRLLEIFAAHLSLLANQLQVAEDAAEPPLVRRARAYVASHLNEPIHLSTIARALSVSTFHFCKAFKRATGLTFTDFLNRVRVEKAKQSLLDPNVRVSEVAYAAGFSSLTHFNRSFRRVEGVSPTDFRRSLPHPPAAGAGATR